MISFRPGEPGPVNVRSIPHSQTSPLRSEVNELGRIELWRPGRSTALASQNAALTAGVLGVGYTATAEDLATPGNWTCRIHNLTLNDIVFDTTITYLSDHVLQTASFDVGLLNLILSEAAAQAQIQVHLQSSNDGSKLSSVSWSPLLDQYLGTPGPFDFHVDDPTPKGHKYRVVGLNTTSAILFVDSASLQLTLRLTFDGGKSALKSLDSAFAQNIDIDQDSLVLDIGFGFDGTLRAACTARATLSADDFADSAADLITGQDADVSADVASNLQQKALSQLQAPLVIGSKTVELSPQLIKQFIDRIFILLMRLAAPPQDAVRPATYQATVQGCRIDGNGALVVNYFVEAVASPVLSAEAVRRMGSAA